MCYVDVGVYAVSSVWDYVVGSVARLEDDH